MKAIISDVHGNLEALQAVLADIQRQQATEIFCIGDIIGYGPNPVECLDLVMNCPVVLLGDHECAVLYGPTDSPPTLQRVINWTRAQFEKPGEDKEAQRHRWQFLQSLPRTYRSNQFLFVHGSARNPVKEYVFPEDIYNPRKMEKIFTQVEKYCVQGHTHVPGVFVESLRYFDLKELDSNLEKNEFRYELDDCKTLINVGSVGQPRDGDWRACYALLDGKFVRFRRVEYDVDTTTKKIYDSPDFDDFLPGRYRDGR
jgi:diadenosine tetraphosphatase ApaH/serine/threonine PP2A family protein phosphatase